MKCISIIHWLFHENERDWRGQWPADTVCHRFYSRMASFHSSESGDAPERDGDGDGVGDGDGDGDGDGVEMGVGIGIWMTLVRVRVMEIGEGGVAI